MKSSKNRMGKMLSSNMKSSKNRMGKMLSSNIQIRTKKKKYQLGGWFGKKKSAAQKEAKQLKKAEAAAKKASKRKPQYIDCHEQSDMYAGVSKTACLKQIKALKISVDKQSLEILPKLPLLSKLRLVNILKAFFEGKGIWNPDDLEHYLKIGDKVKFQYAYQDDDDGEWTDRQESGIILHQQSRDGLTDLAKKMFKKKDYIWKKETGIASGTNAMPPHNERYYSVWSSKLGTSHFIPAGDLQADYTSIDKLFNQTSMEDQISTTLANGKHIFVKGCELGGWPCPVNTKGLKCIDDDGYKYCSKAQKRPGPDCHPAKWTKTISPKIEPIDHALKIWDSQKKAVSGKDLKNFLLPSIKVASSSQVLAFFKEIIKKKGGMDKKWTRDEFKEFATKLTGAVWDETKGYMKKWERGKKSRKDPKTRFKIWPTKLGENKIRLSGTNAECAAVKPPAGTTIADLVVMSDNEDPASKVIHKDMAKLCTKVGCLYDQHRLTDFIEGDGVNGQLCLPIPNVPRPAVRSDMYVPTVICQARDTYTKTHPFYFKCKKGTYRQFGHSESKFDPSKDKFNTTKGDYCVKQRTNSKLKTKGDHGSPLKYYKKECMDNDGEGWEWINSPTTCPQPYPHSMISKTPVGGPGTGKVGECGWIAIEANSKVMNIHPSHSQLYDRKPVLFVRPDSRLGIEIMGSKLPKKTQVALKYMEDNNLGDRIAYATKNIFKKYKPSYPIDNKKCMKAPRPAIAKISNSQLFNNVSSDDYGNA